MNDVESIDSCLIVFVRSQRHPKLNLVDQVPMDFCPNQDNAEHTGIPGRTILTYLAEKDR
jgi:hypothetical protein